MIREAIQTIQEAKSQHSGLKWVGGSDSYKDMKDIENLVLSYDFHSGRIDDLNTMKKAQAKNKAIFDKLKKMGVSAIGNGGMAIGNFDNIDKKDLKEIGK